jgi:hypothetical protein
MTTPALQQDFAEDLVLLKHLLSKFVPRFSLHSA